MNLFCSTLQAKGSSAGKENSPEAAALSKSAPDVQKLGDPSQAQSGMGCDIATSLPSNVVQEIKFSNQGTTVPASDIPALEHLARGWAASGSPGVRIDGFASQAGPEPLNWTVSCQRALSVKAVLMGALPGIPASAIEIQAHGESTDAGPSAADNRRATIHFDPTPIPVSPTPIPSGPLCGPDVTSQVQDVVARTRAGFAGWSAADRENHCDALDSLRTGEFAWDIVELHNNAWILGYRPACASAGAAPPCGSTVQVGTECHYAGSPNYVIFGVMCRLCHDHFAARGIASEAARFTHAEMQSWINFYKGTGPLGLATPSGNFTASTQWATAGYHGWPGSATPTGDRPGCAPGCPTAYSGRPFRTAWWSLSPRARTVL